MTAIAAVTDGSTVWMGGDSAGAAGWDLTVRSDPKVFRNGEFLVGFTTSFRMGQLLRYAFTPPTPREDQDLFAFLVTDFIDAIRSCLKAGGFARKDSEAETGGSFLVGYRGRLFRIDQDYQVGESADRYDAIGCGAEYAKGALSATRERDAEARVKLAIEAAERHSAGVRGPFTILSLASDQGTT